MFFKGIKDAAISLCKAVADHDSADQNVASREEALLSNSYGSYYQADVAITLGDPDKELE